jgi:hypothetical protein
MIDLEAELDRLAADLAVLDVACGNFKRTALNGHMSVRSNMGAWIDGGQNRALDLTKSSP